MQLKNSLGTFCYLLLLRYFVAINDFSIINGGGGITQILNGSFGTTFMKSLGF